jgi:transposase-like protein
MKYDKQKLKTLCAQGANINQIAEAFDCHRISVLRWLSKDNLTLKVRNEGELVKDIQARLDEGVARKNILMEFGLTPKALKEVMHKHNLKKAPSRKRLEKIAMAEQLRSQGLCLREVGEILGMTKEGARLLLLDSKVEVPKKPVVPWKILLIERKWDFYEGLSLGKTQKELAEEWGIPIHQMAWLSKKLGGAEMRAIVEELKREAFFKLYREGHSIYRIARMFDLNQNYLYALFQRYGVKR